MFILPPLLGLGTKLLLAENVFFVKFTLLNNFSGGKIILQSPPTGRQAKFIQQGKNQKPRYRGF